MSEAKRPANLNGAASRLVKSFRIREALRDLAGVKKILDLGCGLCELTDRLPPSVSYVGVERDDWMFERARTLFPQHRFVHADIEAADFDPGSDAEAIVLLAVWEHLSDPFLLLQRAGNWCSSGGRFVLTTPSPGAHAILEWGASARLLSRHADEEHERLWSIDEIARGALSCGWRLVTARRFLLGMNQIVVLQRM